MSFQVIHLLAEGGSFVRITALAVAAERRGKGIGRRLVGEVEERSRHDGAVMAEVSSGRRPDRDAAHAFYPALGYRMTADESVVYRKRFHI